MTDAVKPCNGSGLTSHSDEFGHLLIKCAGCVNCIKQPVADEIAQAVGCIQPVTATGAAGLSQAPNISDPELEHAISELNGAQTYTMRHKEIAVIRAALIERNNLKVERETLKADLEEYKEVAARIQDVAEHYLQEARLSRLWKEADKIGSLDIESINGGSQCLVYIKSRLSHKRVSGFAYTPEAALEQLQKFPRP